MRRLPAYVINSCKIDMRNSNGFGVKLFICDRYFLWINSEIYQHSHTSEYVRNNCNRFMYHKKLCSTPSFSFTYEYTDDNYDYRIIGNDIILHLFYDHAYGSRVKGKHTLVVRFAHKISDLGKDFVFPNICFYNGYRNVYSVVSDDEQAIRIYILRLLYAQKISNEFQRQLRETFM
jgi:hypothetical protein